MHFPGAAGADEASDSTARRAHRRSLAGKLSGSGCSAGSLAAPQQVDGALDQLRAAAALEVEETEHAGRLARACPLEAVFQAHLQQARFATRVVSKLGKRALEHAAIAADDQMADAFGESDLVE